MHEYQGLTLLLQNDSVAMVRETNGLETVAPTGTARTLEGTETINAARSKECSAEINDAVPLEPLATEHPLS